MTTETAAEHISKLRQGQVLELPAVPILSTRSDPLHPAAIAAASRLKGVVPAGLAPILVPVAVQTRRVIVVTQTCDLQSRKTLTGRNLAHVAPIVTLTGGLLSDASTDTRPNFIPIPWAGTDAFADLDAMAAIDRGLLARAQVGSAPPESARRPLAYRLGRYFARPALPDEVVNALRPLQRVADAQHTDLLRVLDAVLEIRVSSDPGYESAGPISLTVILMVDSEWYPDAPPETFRETGKQTHQTATAMVQVFDSGNDAQSGALVTLWQRFRSQVEEKLNSNLSERSDGLVSEVAVVVATALSPSEIEASDVLDFGHLSLSRD